MLLILVVEIGHRKDVTTDKRERAFQTFVDGYRYR
jgi:hypothetical protein